MGFSTLGGNQEQGWLILKNGAHVIGLFQGMFDKNMLTFNPGWDQNAESTTGPAHITMVDPDGNPVLIDQHV